MVADVQLHIGVGHQHQLFHTNQGDDQALGLGAGTHHRRLRQFVAVAVQDPEHHGASGGGGGVYTDRDDEALEVVGQVPDEAGDHLYADGKPEDATPPVTLSKKLPKPPQAAWVFMLRPETSAEPGKRWASRLEEVEPVLAAYGLNIANLLDILKDDPFTLTFRISRNENGQGIIDHVTPTVGRRFR